MVLYRASASLDWYVPQQSTIYKGYKKKFFQEDFGYECESYASFLIVPCINASWTPRTGALS